MGGRSLVKTGARLPATPRVERNEGVVIRRRLLLPVRFLDSKAGFRLGLKKTLQTGVRYMEPTFFMNHIQTYVQRYRAVL